MKFKLIIALFSLSIFCSCSIHLAASKDASVIADVLDLSNSSDALYNKIIAAPDKSFANYEQDYKQIEIKFDSVVSVDKQRHYAANIVHQVVIAQGYFKKYEADHQSRYALTTGELMVYRDYMHSFIKPILVSELSLK